MKKILALFLALCLMLAALPVVAENDFSGTWYLLLAGMTCGTFELNADGSFTGESGADEEIQKTEGTWSADGDQVTLTVDSVPLVVSYDGTDLLLNTDAEALATMDISSLDGIDMSILDGLVKFSREPGKITPTEFAVYMADSTVPEGKSAEDFTEVLIQLTPIYIAITAAMDSGDQTAPISGTDETAKPEVTVLEENFYIRESYFGREAVYIAKVKNNNDIAVYIDNGKLILKDADGNEVGKREWFGTSGSRYLSPGEVSYVSFLADIDEGVTVAGFEKEINASDFTYSEDAAVELSGVELRSEEMFSSVSYHTAATFTNNGEEPLSGVEVLFVLRDSEGKMIYISERGLGSLELGAGSTITVVDDVSSSVVDYCEANGLTVGEVEAVAWK